MRLHRRMLVVAITSDLHCSFVPLRCLDYNRPRGGVLLDRSMDWSTSPILLKQVDLYGGQCYGDSRSASSLLLTRGEHSYQSAGTDNAEGK